jgi:hypothetical protein
MSNGKVFLFCIGGTGSRVLKALIYLLASGVRIKADKVIPIIMDPDRENGDVNRTIELLKRYQVIRKRLEFQHNGFFYTDVQTLSSLDVVDEKGKDLKIAEGFKYEIDGTRQGKFGEFLELNQLDTANKALIQTLFSEQNLGADLAVGFKGNPHMGSVVLNQFTQSNEFKFFASRLNERDRVFIVSSIFGGTGAAGFPLLVKNIRNAPIDFPNHDRLRGVPLGAITVMPYFGVQPDASIAIDKNTFISKTKAALAYYEKHLSSSESSALNALYYIADPVTGDVRPNEGGKGQKNNAHYIELLSALSIVDFMDIPIDNRTMETTVTPDKGGRALSPVFKDYGLDIGTSGAQKLNFLHLGRLTLQRIARPLIQYSYAINYWKRHLEEALIGANQQAFARAGGLDATFLNSEFYRDLDRFNTEFLQWLKEMDQNERSFQPLNPDVNDGLLHRMVEGVKQHKRGFGPFAKEEWGYSEFDSVLNRADKSLSNLKPEHKLMAIFYKATAAIYDEHKIGVPLGV